MWASLQVWWNRKMRWLFVRLRNTWRKVHQTDWVPIFHTRLLSMHLLLCNLQLFVRRNKQNLCMQVWIQTHQSQSLIDLYGSLRKWDHLPARLRVWWWQLEGWWWMQQKLQRIRKIQLYPFLSQSMLASLERQINKAQLRSQSWRRKPMQVFILSIAIPSSLRVRKLAKLSQLELDRGFYDSWKCTIWVHSEHKWNYFKLWLRTNDLKSDGKSHSFI